MNKFLLGLVITLMMAGSGYTKNFEKRVNQELILIFEVSYKEDIEVIEKYSYLSHLLYPQDMHESQPFSVFSDLLEHVGQIRNSLFTSIDSSVGIDCIAPLSLTGAVSGLSMILTS